MKIKYNDNNIKLHYYLHNIIFGRYTTVNYDMNNKNMKAHLTNAYIQGSQTNFIFNDNIFFDKIKNYFTNLDNHNLALNNILRFYL